MANVFFTVFGASLRFFAQILNFRRIYIVVAFSVFVRSEIFCVRTGQFLVFFCIVTGQWIFEFFSYFNSHGHFIFEFSEIFHWTLTDFGWFLLVLDRFWAVLRFLDFAILINSHCFVNFGFSVILAQIWWFFMVLDMSWAGFSIFDFAIVMNRDCFDVFWILWNFWDLGWFLVIFKFLTKFGRQQVDFFSFVDFEILITIKAAEI